MTLEQLVEKLIKYNDAYRIGFPVISDTEYDLLVDELRDMDPDHEFLQRIGFKVSEERKSRLPIEMASMEKEKDMNDLLNWIRLKGISMEEEVVITPKFDGAAMAVHEIPSTPEAWTRGDGEFGQKSDAHYSYIQNKLKSPICAHTYGEVMMRKSVFDEKYSDEFKNPRNLVSGRLNADEPSDILSDMEYVKYGAVGLDLPLKSDILDALNANQDYQVPYIRIKIKDLTEEFLTDTFFKWSAEDYEIDGVILEINSIALQNSLGRERNNNPVWARAFKSPNFEASAETTPRKIVYTISKKGLCKPVVHFDPIELNGVVISCATGYNARFIKNMGIGVGSVIVIKRSGMVIPKIVDVITPVPFTMPVIDGLGPDDIEWDENGVELRTMYETDSQKIKKITAFFLILGVKDVSEQTFVSLWNAGYQSIKAILEMSKEDFMSIEGFKERRSEKTFEAIHSKMKNVELSKLQHASGLFSGLGSKKLLLLEKFYNHSDLSIDSILCIDGFHTKSAMMYLNGIAEFKSFVSNLNVTVAETKEIEVGSDELRHEVVVFTGVRSKQLEDIIIYRGGKIGSGVSSKTTKLVMKAKGSGSSKEKKALQLGIEIMDIADLEKFLGIV